MLDLIQEKGKHSVLVGTGYTDTCIVDSWHGLPVYWDAVNASKNDNTIPMKHGVSDAVFTPLENFILIREYYFHPLYQFF